MRVDPKTDGVRLTLPWFASEAEALVVQICEYFHLIWDDYEEMHRLAAISHPKVTVDTSGLSPVHTELANTLSEKIRDLPEQDAIALLARLRGDLY